MALVPLTSAQKSILQSDPNFKNECNWAMINEAEFWFGQDGSSPPASDWVSWAKKRFFGVNNIINIPFDVDYYTRLVLINLDQAVYDNSVPFDVQNVINYMLSNNIFQIIAGQIFDLKKQSILF